VSTRSNTNASEEHFPVPFTVPDGWQGASVYYEINTIPGGGPIDGREVTRVGSGNEMIHFDLFVSIKAFQYDHDVSLSEILTLAIGWDGRVILHDPGSSSGAYRALSVATFEATWSTQGKIYIPVWK
jgi:hypothetical protein